MTLTEAILDLRKSIDQLRAVVGDVSGLADIQAKLDAVSERLTGMNDALVSQVTAVAQDVANVKATIGETGSL